jgi:hypothetical protein
MGFSARLAFMERANVRESISFCQQNNSGKEGGEINKWTEGQLFADVDGAFKAHSQQRKSKPYLHLTPPSSPKVKGARDIPAIFVVKVEATDAQHHLVYPIFR